MKKDSLIPFFLLIVLLYVIAQPVIIILKLIFDIGLSWASVFVLPISVAIAVEAVILLISIITYTWKEWRKHE